ncbi:MAG: (2Fe-2S) ferredoxin domain-containing protein [Arcobacteraceae bacterium]|nr:(2Fe-2S) ferredoxin domain-containing protein [Arcobacteraceae bacterium]
MENKTYNTMGSEVLEGFTCKPKKLDPDKPIMFFKTQIFICDGERCSKAQKDDDLAGRLRGILKELQLHKGKNRIKISRTNCFGACRFRQVAVAFENTKANGNLENNNIWLKNIHKFDDIKWKELFLDLSTDKPLDELSYEQVPMSGLDE